MILPFQVAKQDVLGIGVAIVVLALLIATRISHRIGGPVQDLTRAADELAKGNLAAKVEVTNDDDEIGLLGRSFNEMARRIDLLLQETAKKARAAEQANQAKSTFLATMSHEIRTPLNGVLGYAEQLLESELDDEQRQYAGIVLRSGEDLMAILNDILDFSKIEAGQMEVDEIDFHLPTALKARDGVGAPAGQGQGARAGARDRRGRARQPRRTGQPPAADLDQLPQQRRQVHQPRPRAPARVARRRGRTATACCASPSPTPASGSPRTGSTACSSPSRRWTRRPAASSGARVWASRSARSWRS